ncbi:MAG: cation diffusion facilitator family transporter [Thermoanaerobaculia bacterium]|jgi:cation diffusion facilitator family transporter
MDQELKTLLYAAFGQLFFAALGILFAFLTDSDAIMLDGFFSLIGFGMSLLTMRVARLVRQPDDQWFHFGYARFEPLLNLLKGIVILGVCGLSLASAIQALLHGGRELNLGPAVIYSILAVVGCFTVAALLSRAAKKSGSPLIDVEVHTWRIDAIMSLGVLAAFAAAFFVDRTRWSQLVDYVDPALVIVLVLAVISTPIRIVWDGLGELLGAAPKEPVQREVEEKFRELLEGYPVVKTVLRMERVGRTSYLLAHVVVEPDLPLAGIEELDELRRQIASGIQELHPSWIVDTVFVADESLAV